MWLIFLQALFNSCNKVVLSPIVLLLVLVALFYVLDRIKMNYVK